MKAETRKRILMTYIAAAVTANFIANLGAYVFHWWAR